MLTQQLWTSISFIVIVAWSSWDLRAGQSQPVPDLEALLTRGRVPDIWTQPKISYILYCVHLCSLQLSSSMASAGLPVTDSTRICRFSQAYGCVVM